MCLRLLVLTAPKTSLALNRSQLATDLLRYLLAPLHPVTDTDSTVSNPLSEPQHPSAGGRCLCVCARAATNSLGPCLSTKLWQTMTRLDGDSHHNCIWLYAGFQSRLSGSKSGNSLWFIDGSIQTRTAKAARSACGLAATFSNECKPVLLLQQARQTWP